MPRNLSIQPPRSPVPTRGTETSAATPTVTTGPSSSVVAAKTELHADALACAAAKPSSQLAPQSGVVGLPATAWAHAPDKASAKFDYVVVGAGAGGAMTASRLADEGYRVLVLERGDENVVPEREAPALHGLASEHPDLLVGGKGYFVRHLDDAKANETRDNFTASEGGTFMPRGEGIGGSTQMNAMISVRADDSDWNKIAEIVKDDSWSADEMQAFYALVENTRYKPVDALAHRIGESLGIDALKNRHGRGFNPDGLDVSQPKLSLLVRALKDPQIRNIVLKTAVHAFTDVGSLRDRFLRAVALADPNDRRLQGTEGLTRTPVTVTDGGRRTGARARLLEVMAKHPDRITVGTGANVKNVVFDEKTNQAIGVRFTGVDGQEHTVAARRDVVLATGTFEDSGILMRSGIGPQEELAKLESVGVQPRLIREGVGRGVGDRNECGVVFRMKKPLALFDDAKFKTDPKVDAEYARFLEGKGLYTTPGALIATQTRSDPSQPEPNLYNFLVPGIGFTGYHPGYATEGLDPTLATWVILDENKGPKDGTLTIDAANPEGRLNANFRLDAKDADANAMALVNGIKNARKMIATYGDDVVEEVWPGAHVQSDEDLLAAVKNNSWGHHPRGGTPLGHADDPKAVVDGSFNVIGTKNLKVVSASVFPENIGSFIVNPLMTMAEKAAATMLAEAKADDQRAYLNWKPDRLPWIPTSEELGRF